MAQAKIDVEEAKKDPSAAFEDPMDVVRAEGLTIDEKREILRVWEEDARELQVASEEAMTGGEPDRLREVLRAKAALDPQASTRPSAHGGKQGYHK